MSLEEKLKKELRRIASQKFNRFEIDSDELEWTSDSLVETYGETALRIPDLVEALIDYAIKTKATIDFSDVISFCEAINYQRNVKVMDVLHERYFPQEHVEIGLIKFANILERTAGNGVDLSEFKHLPIPPGKKINIDPSTLSEDRKRMISYWKGGMNDEILLKSMRFLLDKQDKHGDFRTWLEAQPATAELKKEFKKLGLNYSAWDNPNVAYGYKTALEKIVADTEKAKMAAEDLTKRLTRGDLTGCLITKPAQVFKAIGALYKNMKTAEDVQALLVELEKHISPKSLQGGKLANEWDKIKALSSGADLEQAGRNYDFVFRTWRRQPSYDFCEGNDSGICTSFNGTSGEAMINYLVDKDVSLVDVIHKGKRHGQIYLFGAVDENGRPLLVLDSLEVGNNSFIESKKMGLYTATEEVVNDIAKKTGFKKVFISGTLYWRHSSGFLDYILHKHDIPHDHDSINWFGERVEIVHPGSSRLDEIVISKIGNTRTINGILGELGRRFPDNYIGRKHYFDIYGVLGQEDTFDWKENCDNYRARGVLLDVD